MAKTRQEHPTTKGTVPVLGKRQRRRKPKAEILLFGKPQNIYSTSLLVPWKTNDIVKQFQDILPTIESALQGRRPNIAASAGWLIRKGLKFATRHRVHGVDQELGKVNVQLGIRIDRRAWAEIQKIATVENITMAQLVPRLIALGAEQHPVPQEDWGPEGTKGT